MTRGQFGHCFQSCPAQSRLGRRDQIEIDNIPDIPTSHERPNLTEGRWGWSSKAKFRAGAKVQIDLVPASVCLMYAQVSCRTGSVIGFFWVSLRLRSSQVQRMSAEILVLRKLHCAFFFEWIVLLRS